MKALVQTFLAGVAGALTVVVLVGAAGPLALRDDGIQFPDGSLQTTAAVEVRTPIDSLPFPISQSGSYYLTGNLFLAGGDGIHVTADNVTIDFMGFTIDGMDSANRGVFIDGPRHNVEVRNGTVRSFLAEGLLADGSGSGHSHRMIAMRFMDNGKEGAFLLGRGHLIRDCSAANNGDSGLKGGSGSVLVYNTAYNNAGTSAGMNGQNGSVLIGNAASFNQGEAGITGEGTFLANAAANNAEWGFAVGGGSTVIANTAEGNNTVGSSDYGGFRAGGTSLLFRNGAFFNGHAGFHIFGNGGNVIEGNFATDSPRGILFAADGSFWADNRATRNGVDFDLGTTTQTDGGGNTAF